MSYERASEEGSTVDRESVHAAAAQAALVFKWIESDRAGVDLGVGAVRHWFREHWWAFVRSCWLEHIQGWRFWIELDRGDFGLLQREFRDHPVLLDRVLDRLAAGHDNLMVLSWAADWGIPPESVCEILAALDINSHRLEYRPAPIEEPRPTLAPDWLAWNGGTIVRLAWGIALDGDLAALPVLHDALEDAGCGDAGILEHCRDARWPWLVDAVLELSWSMRSGILPTA